MRAFRTKFRFRIGAGPKTADGFTFCLQGGDPTALGRAAADSATRTSPTASPSSSTCGTTPAKGRIRPGCSAAANAVPPGSIDLTPGGIDLHSGRAYDAAIDYKAGKLTLQITDAEDPGKQFIHTFDVDVPAAVGKSRACAASRPPPAAPGRCRTCCRGPGNRRPTSRDRRGTNRDAPWCGGRVSNLPIAPRRRESASWKLAATTNKTSLGLALTVAARRLPSPWRPRRRGDKIDLFTVGHNNHPFPPEPVTDARTPRGRAGRPAAPLPAARRDAARRLTHDSPPGPRPRRRGSAAAG